MKNSTREFHATLYLWFFFVSLLVGPTDAQEWLGFRGAGSQGWAANATPPENWGPDENVLWSIPIPGEGHSSPIVHEGTVYITSAYETDRFKRMLHRFDVASLIGGWLVLIAGIFLAADLRNSTDSKSPGRIDKILRRWIHPILLVALTILVVSLVWTSDRWADPEENDMRAWKLHTGIVVLGLVTSALCIPFASKGWHAVAVSTPIVSALIYMARPDKRELFQFDSFSATVNNLVPFVPVGLGLFLTFLWITFHASRQSSRKTWLSYGTAALLFVLVGSKFGTVHFLKGSSELFRSIHALNLGDGSLRWSCENLPGKQDRMYHLNSPATPTPVTDGEHVFAYFGSAGLVCVNRDGKVCWTRKDLPSECRFIHASSPILMDGVLIITRDLETTDGDSFDTNFFITGLSPVTGKTLWEESFSYPDTFANYSTATADQGEGLVWVRTWQEILAIEPRTGAVAWRYSLPYSGNHLVASPVVDENHVYLMTGTEVVCLDRSRVDSSNFGNAITWRQPLKGEACASPLLAKGRLVVVTERSYASCYEAATGKLLYEQRLRGKFFSSVIGAGNTVYFCNERGNIYVNANEPHFRQIAEHDLGEKIYASITPTDDRLLIRTLNRLYYFGSQ